MINVYEDIIQEKFRQMLIKEGIAGDYILLHEDDFEFREDNCGVFGTIGIFKDSNDIWIIWEVDEYGAYYNIAIFRNQIDAYVNAAKRRGLNLFAEDFKYDMSDRDDMLSTIENAKDFLLAGFKFYDGLHQGQTKLQRRYLQLDSFEKQINNTNGKKLFKNLDFKQGS